MAGVFLYQEVGPSGAGTAADGLSWLSTVMEKL